MDSIVIAEEIIEIKDIVECAVKAITVNSYERNPEARENVLGTTGKSAQFLALTLAKFIEQLGLAVFTSII
ncbi:MAG: hypothetical protein ACU4EQ_00300 [Candidatus Nitrosoglobus sp.]